MVDANHCSPEPSVRRERLWYSRHMPALLVVALLVIACSRDGAKADPPSEMPLTKAAEQKLRAALDPVRLGVSADAPAAQWLARLRAAVLARPRPKLYAGATDATVVTMADDALHSGWRLRDHAPLRLKPPIDWAALPKGDANWHYALNALHPVGNVLAAYELTQHHPYFEAARAVLLDWIDFNITRGLPNKKKWYDMGTGYRAEKLAFIVDDELRSPSPDPDVVATLLSAAVDHARVLADPKQLAGANHAVFMMLGLAALCRAVPELQQCDRHAEYAVSTLERVLERQFFLDEAIHLEGAPSYHLFMCSTLQRLRRTELFAGSPRLANLLDAAQRHLPRMFHPNGDAVLIGDSAAADMATLIEQSAEARFVHSEGAEGIEPAPASVSFPKTGYAIFRSPWTEKPFRQHSFLFFSAAWHHSSHNHRDHFTFEWSESGFPILVDSGKFSYGKGSWRKFFQSTRAGNALEIDGKDLAQVPHLSSLRAFGQDGALHFADAVATRGKVEHTRLVVLHMRQWLSVIDRLKAPDEHTYRQWFHFHEAIDASRLPEGTSLGLALPSGGPRVFVQSTSSTGSLEPKLLRGKGGRSPQGWISREYRAKVPRSSVSFSARGRSMDLVTVFSLHAPATAVRLKPAGAQLEVSWQRNGAVEGFRYESEHQGQLVQLKPRRGDRTPSAPPRAATN